MIVVLDYTEKILTQYHFHSPFSDCRLFEYQEKTTAKIVSKRIERVGIVAFSHSNVSQFVDSIIQVTLKYLICTDGRLDLLNVSV